MENYNLNTVGEAQKTNKEKIFEVSIKLFAMKGFSDVSVRDIATEVGIKASSIYNHFQSKDEILESIFQYFVTRLEVAVYTELNQEVLFETIQPEAFFYQNVQTTMNLMRSPLMQEIITIIRREQFTNQRIRKFLLQEMIQRPRENFEKLFAKLIEHKLIKPLDPKILAKEYQAFSIYQYYENSILIDTGPVDLDQDERDQKEHIRFFWDAIKIIDKEV